MHTVDKMSICKSTEIYIQISFQLSKNKAMLMIHFDRGQLLSYDYQTDYFPRYAMLYLQIYFKPMYAERNCPTLKYIKELNAIICTQKKILQTHLKPPVEEWMINTDRDSLLSNANRTYKIFENWAKDQSTCHFCRSSVEANRYIYCRLIDDIKAFVIGNKMNINAKSLIHTIEGVQINIAQIKQDSNCPVLRQFIHLLD